MYCQHYDYTEKDIVVYDNSNKYIFHNALYPTVSYFMCKDSVKSNVFYVHYEASSIVKKEFILQVMFKDGKLFLIGELVTINMSSQVEEMGFSPVMLIKGNQELSKEIILYGVQILSNGNPFIKKQIIINALSLTLICHS
ncbi:hypothetical protein DW980_15370 [Bacteroides stercoris]|nr:hypothetical protein DW980_15370 [Bacteroides stercoris]